MSRRQSDERMVMKIVLYNPEFDENYELITQVSDQIKTSPRFADLLTCEIVPSGLCADWPWEPRMVLLKVVPSDELEDARDKLTEIELDSIDRIVTPDDGAEKILLFCIAKVIDNLSQAMSKLVTKSFNV